MTCHVTVGGVSYPIKFNAYKEQANITLDKTDYFDMPSLFLFHHGHMSKTSKLIRSSKFIWQAYRVSSFV
jgi:hypothetical protein